MSAGAGPFDVEWFRSLGTRAAVVRRSSRRMLVLGSTQPADIVSSERAASRDVAVVRRRSGGGAVFVDPGDPIWVDLWIPSSDELFEPDVVHAARWVGDCWAAALGGLGAEGLEVHRGPLVPRPWSDVVCFAGLGPGEVVAGPRKVVGVAQWRSRQGSLFHSAAYRRWDPAKWTTLLALDEAERSALTVSVRAAGVGLDELVRTPVDPEAVVAAVLESLPGPGAWQVLSPAGDQP
jgi:lipoate---protein ligase